MKVVHTEDKFADKTLTTFLKLLPKNLTNFYSSKTSSMY